MGAVTVVATGWLAAQIAKILFKGSGNVPNTIGYLAYGQVLEVVKAVVSAVFILLGLGAMATGGVNALNLGTLMGAAGLIGIVGIVFALWGLYIAGAAVGTANGIRILFGAVCALIAGLIVGIIAFSVGLILGITFAMLGFGAMMGAGAAAGVLG